jgi:glutamate decarboxylase
MELTEYMVKRIKSMFDKFYLILEPELVNVSFWYVPTRLRSMPHGPEREKLLGEVSTRDQSELYYWIPVK